MSDLKEMLKNLDISIKAEFALNNPNHAWIGPSVVEEALNRINELENQMKFTEADVQKLDLKPGEVLVVKIKSDELDQYSMDSLSKGLKSYFPKNKVLIMGVGEEGSIDLTVVKDVMYSEPVKEDCSTIDYCSSCACGKKEAFEAKQRGEK